MSGTEQSTRVMTTASRLSLSIGRSSACVAAADVGHGSVQVLQQFPSQVCGAETLEAVADPQVAPGEAGVLEPAQVGHHVLPFQIR